MLMLKTIAAILLTLCPQQVITGNYRKIFTSGGGSSPTVVQSAENTAACNFGTCGPYGPASGLTNGNKVVILLANGDSGADACTDNLSNSLTEQSGSPQATTSAAAGGNFLHAFAYTVPSAGVTNFTCTFVGSFAEYQILEIHNSPGAATMQALTTSAYSFGNCTPSPSATPTASPSIAFGVYYGDISGPSVGSGWTLIGTVNTSGEPFFLEYKVQTGTSPVTATASGTCGAHGPDAFVNIW